MYEYFNPNPVGGNGVADCAVRAIARALDLTWEQAYVRLAMNGYLMGNLPNADVVWGAVLREEGFRREIVPNTCSDCYTVDDFCKDHPKGTFVVKSENHVATIWNGILYDSWDSSGNVPVYYWTNRKDDGV